MTLHLNQSNGFPCRCSDCEDERRRKMTKPKIPKQLDAVVDIVLAYRPKAKSKPARRRKRRGGVGGSD